MSSCANSTPVNQEPISKRPKVLNLAVPYVDLARQFEVERQYLLPELEKTLATGKWVSDIQVQQLEEELAALHGVSDVVAVGSGTDALILGMKALGIGPGDEVITPPNSFVSSTAAIVEVGATPVFCDVQGDQLIDPRAAASKIGEKTKAIMPVHLSGRCCDMDAIKALAQKHGLLVVEDAAQAFGAKWKDGYAGSFGDVGCFSAHPLKNLNAVGDAGFVYCRSPEVSSKIRRLRSNGMSDRNTVLEWGRVSRMDALQAVVLLHRLKSIDDVTKRRRENAGFYFENLAGTPLTLSRCRSEQYSVFHTFVVQAPNRDRLKSHLDAQGIGTSIHYPVPIHLQPAAKNLGYKVGDFPVVEAQANTILSLPIHQFLEPSQLQRVCSEIKRFYQ